MWSQDLIGIPCVNMQFSNYMYYNYIHNVLSNALEITTDNGGLLEVYREYYNSFWGLLTVMHSNTEPSVRKSNQDQMLLSLLSSWL